MKYIPRFVDDNVAFSRMPTLREVDEVLEKFDAIVVLVEGFELPYSPNEWVARGVEVLHSPIPDFGAPSVEELLRVLEWIDGQVRRDKRVLIHCMGGCGRSGMVAVAWLMYSQGLTLRDALSRVRAIRPCAVETEGQMEALQKLEKYLKQPSSR